MLRGTTWEDKTWLQWNLDRERHEKASSLQSLSGFHRGEKGSRLPQQLRWSSSPAGSTSCTGRLTAFSSVLPKKEKLSSNKPILGKKGDSTKSSWFPPPKLPGCPLFLSCGNEGGSQLARELNNKQTQHCLARTNNLQSPQSQPFLPSHDEYSVSRTQSYFSVGGGVFLGCRAGYW